MARRGQSSLHERLAGCFEPDVRERGDSYYRSGFVDILSGGPEDVRAVVSGNDEYLVTIRARDGGLLATCDCPFFLDREQLCKHAWAVVRTAEREGFLGGMTAPGLRIRPDVHDALEEEDEDTEGEPAPPEPPPPPRRWNDQPPPPPPVWRQVLDLVERSAAAEPAGAAPAQPFVVRYLVDPLVSKSFPRGFLALSLHAAPALKSGKPGKPRPFSREHFETLACGGGEADRRLVAILQGGDAVFRNYSGSQHFGLHPDLVDTVLPQLVDTGRLFVAESDGAERREHGPLAMDPGPAWSFHLAVARKADGFTATAHLRRGTTPPGELAIGDALLMLEHGWLFTRAAVARLDPGCDFAWIRSFRQYGGSVVIPAAAGRDFAMRVLAHRAPPAMDLPEELRPEEVDGVPRPVMTISPSAPGLDTLPVRAVFDYGEAIAGAGSRSRLLAVKGGGRMIRRDLQAEEEALAPLPRLGFARRVADAAGWTLPAANLGRAVPVLLESGWRVEAEGRPCRQGRWSRVEVDSGVDWFDLRMEASFDGIPAPLPALLAALRGGDRMIVLGDGSLGVLPEEWLSRWGLPARAGKAGDEALRFSAAQASLLVALVADLPAARLDEPFRRVCEALRSFRGLEPAREPEGFQGELRDYQREGLGWLLFLDRFGFGGCLADDMGLGKTVQVLAFLAALRGRPRPPDEPRASLAVVPRSLLENWRREAERFAPGLRVLVHAGGEREREAGSLAAADLVLTTYGTMRRDVELLAGVEWRLAILDEAQAVKNDRTDTARAARRLRARGRLAMSGTPVENHLGELWSLMDFLNPGLLGTASVFRTEVRRPAELDDAGRALLSRALRPFILRRTKEQVARDLPPCTEQTVYCELEGAERREYDELREHYRRVLLHDPELDLDEGLGPRTMNVLEALLRLRQAACHPGLIDAGRTAEPSAKVDTLLAQLAEIGEEDHKALVFSQFTSLLAIVRGRLDRAGASYAYLDGATRDRDGEVRRFQEDPACRLFLVSLKAGGTGLNLTAADYVFLLDPWWNPAVEAQAIDRTHRIGQSRPVFAYRLIARDTVEEKVLKLQEGKRELADAILGAGGESILQRLTRADLELLLG